MRARVAIVGGGVNGLGIAYRLARHHGITDTVVLEREYVMYGGSGRNGGGVRAQWATLANLDLARRSIPMWKRLGPELGIHTWFRQSGYIMLARDRAALPALRARAAFQRANGVPTHVVGVEEAARIVPHVNLDDIAGASYCPEDAVVFPWPVVNGLYERATALGVRVLQKNAVKGVEVRRGSAVALDTTAGRIEADWIVNAAGAWSSDVNAMAGVASPNRPVRHEILATESLRPFLDPMVVDLGDGLYASQDSRGEVIAGIENPDEPVGLRMTSSYGFLRRAAAALSHRFPLLRRVNVLRQWAGCYDVSPDAVPILGPAPDVENLVLCCGFSGHGFMVAPAVTTALASLVATGRPTIDLAPYSLSRFAAGATHAETMVIG